MAGTTHTVKQGETLLSIAGEHGFSDWEAIWKHANNTDLRALRDDPQVLLEGDRVFVPDKREKQVSVATDRHHTFAVKRLKAWYRTIVLNEFGDPLTNAPFQLELADRTLQGVTDGSGMLELQVDPRPAKGILVVTDATGRTLTWHLNLGQLDPIEELTGVKARLANLGFPCGAIDNELNEETRQALRNFQIVYKLEVTALLDDATRAKLKAAHDQR